MKVLVTGDREWTDRDMIRRALSQYPAGTVLIHGAARGADSLADSVGKELGFVIDAKPADWKRLGRAAGPIRNQEMVNQAPDVVHAFHDYIGASRGTRDCLERADRLGIPIYLHTHTAL
jgi:hypothetical protein